LKLPPKKLVTI